MKKNDWDPRYPCPCYKKSMDCPAGFEKVLALKNAGLTIYRHSMKSGIDKATEKSKKDLDVDDDVFIFHNTKDVDITSVDFLPEIETKTAACTRCRQIKDHALKMLQNVTTISKNEVIGICDHCKQKQKPCCECIDASKKFFGLKRGVKENVLSKKRVGEWSNKVKRELKYFAGDKKIRADLLTGYTEHDKERLRLGSGKRIDKPNRLEQASSIRKLYRESECESLRPPITEMGKVKKKKHLLKFDNRLKFMEAEDSYSFELGKNTKLSITHDKETKKDIISQTYSPKPGIQSSDYYQAEDSYTCPLGKNTKLATTQDTEIKKVLISKTNSSKPGIQRPEYFKAEGSYTFALGNNTILATAQDKKIMNSKTNSPKPGVHRSDYYQAEDSYTFSLEKNTKLATTQDKEIKKRITSQTNSPKSGIQRSSYYYKDDILPTDHLRRHAHDKEKLEVIDQKEETIKINKEDDINKFKSRPASPAKDYFEQIGNKYEDLVLKHDFDISFPKVKHKLVKNEQQKSSSELVYDIYERIRQKNREITRRNEEMHLNKIKEKEKREQLAQKEKLIRAQAKNKIAKKTSFTSLHLKQSKSQADEIVNSSKSESDMKSLTALENIKREPKSKTKKDESLIHQKSHKKLELKKTKDERKQKSMTLKIRKKQPKDYVKQRIQDEKQENTESESPRSGTKQPKVEGKELETESESPKSDKSKRSKTESNKSKSESNKSKGESNKSKGDSKQVEPELKQLKTKLKEAKDKISTQSNAESKQLKSESIQPQAESNQMKAEKKQLKVESTKSETEIKQPKTESKELKAELKLESEQLKFKPITESKHYQPNTTDTSISKKSEFESTTEGSDSKNTAAGAREFKTKPKEFNADSKSPKTELKEIKADFKEFETKSKEPKAALQKPKSESIAHKPKSKDPQAQSKDSKAEFKGTAQSKRSKVESIQSKFESEDSARTTKAHKFNLKENKDDIKGQKDEAKIIKDKVKIITEKNEENDAAYIEKTVLSQTNKPKKGEVESVITHGIYNKDRSVTRVPRRQLDAQSSQGRESTNHKKDFNANNIFMLKSSQNVMPLNLVKVKKGEKKHRTLSQIMTYSQILTHLDEHKTIKVEGCPMCINSNMELEYETRKQQISALREIITGRKIRSAPYHIDEKVEQVIKPVLFHIKYDETFRAEVIQEAKYSPVMVRKYSIKTAVKPAKTLSEDQSIGVIRYALSDRAFIEKGWTMLPTEKVVRKMNIYRMRPAHPEFDWFKRNKNKRLMTYDTGEKLAEFDDDGRGRWYYKNQRLALQYYDAEEINAQQRFVIFSNGEPDERGRPRPYTILAMFDYLGNGIVFDHGGKIRLKYNQSEGVVLDRKIGPPSHWKWHSLNDPPILQQVMIDTQMTLKDPDILRMGGPDEKNANLRAESEDMLAIEFENFVKEKNKKLDQSFKPFQIKMKAMKINEHFSLKILDQANIYLIYRDGTTNIKLNLGMLLDNKEIVDTDTAEFGEVPNNLERFPARTDSLAQMQKSVAYARHFERSRTERERRLRPLEPSASADKLLAAVSRPMQPPLYAVHSSSTPTITLTGTSKLRSRKPSQRNVYYDSRLF